MACSTAAFKVSGSGRLCIVRSDVSQNVACGMVRREGRRTRKSSLTQVMQPHPEPSLIGSVSSASPPSPIRLSASSAATRHLYHRRVDPVPSALNEQRYWYISPCWPDEFFGSRISMTFQPGTVATCPLDLGMCRLMGHAMRQWMLGPRSTRSAN